MREPRLEKRKRFLKYSLSGLLLAAGLILSLAACGTPTVQPAARLMSKSFSYDGWNESYAAADAVSASAAYGNGEAALSADDSGISSESAKLIRTIDLSLRVSGSEDLKPTIDAISELTASCGGYTTNTYMNANSSYASGSMTVKVPKDRADDWLNTVEEQGFRILSMSDHLTDVTLEYVDVEARLRVKEAARDKYMEYLKLAENVEDIMRIENELNAVIEEIESARSRLNRLDNQIDYTEISVDISCETTAQKESFGYRLKEELIETAQAAVDTLFDGIGFLLPFLVGYLFFVPIAFLVIRTLFWIFRWKPSDHKGKLQAWLTRRSKRQGEKQKETADPSADKETMQ